MSALPLSADASGRRVDRARAAFAAPTGIELALLAGLVVFYQLVDELYGSASYEFLNLAGPLWLVVALTYGAGRLVLEHPASIWTALFWLRVVTAVYYGVGAIIPFFVNDLTRSVIERFHFASTDQMMKVNVITAFGALTLLAAASVTSRLMRSSVVQASRAHPGRELLLWGVIFGAIGLVVKYVLVVPFSFGLTTSLLPGAILQLSQLTAVGIYLVGAWAFTYARKAIPAVTAFTAADMLVGLMTFSKHEVIFALLMFGLATIHARVTRFRLAFGAAAACACFLVIAPIVDFGRQNLMLRYRSITGAGFGERLEILQSYFTGSNPLGNEAFTQEFQGAFARLSYMHQSAFAVQLHDSGRAGDTIEAILIVAIPRVVWPEKPNLNYLGQAFNLSATGGDTSLSWPGQYVEAYWNLGWWGIPVLLIPLGAIYAILSNYAIGVFLGQRWAYFPVALFALRYATEVSSPYATAAVGGLIFIIFAHVGCAIAERGVGWLRPRSAVSYAPPRARVLRGS